MNLGGRDPAKVRTPCSRNECVSVPCSCRSDQIAPYTMVDRCGNVFITPRDGVGRGSRNKVVDAANVDKVEKEKEAEELKRVPGTGL